MSKNKPDGQDALERAGRVFRDTLYTSRTLVFPDGSTAPVVEGRVTASSDELLALLKKHPDLQLMQE
ncbi:hypothetical protein [Pseudomonas sp. SXM-1]|jgi:hypothetical protein|uniref:hypothetical protein n=1 Tax=Pseudomonas sp. SXM-1 TaxID=2169583 RepID=UPI001067CD5B|nr:hypothetical protein [Pseudomonas sp. SXM-1]QBQ11081.1 hypothetical protein DCC84_15685 [Pseudomonas sp. SXM-1]